MITCGNVAHTQPHTLVYTTITIQYCNANHQDVFEVGRRHKIMNPDRMRSEYGKLMYMLMDSADSSIQELLEFKVCVYV